jgi:hypothetical protein
MKACTKCGETKPLEAFSKNGRMGLHTSCKTCQCETARLMRLKRPEIVKAREKAQALKHAEARKARVAAYYAANRADRLAQEKARYAAQADSRREAAKRYRQQNASMVRVWNNARRAACRQAMPVWADRDVMASLYALAAIYSDVIGEKCHVDHVIPLKGREVCGLHCEANMQVLPASENLRKGRSVAP